MAFPGGRQGGNGRWRPCCVGKSFPGTTNRLLLHSLQSHDCLSVSLSASQLGSAGRSFQAMQHSPKTCFGLSMTPFLLLPRSDITFTLHHHQKLTCEVSLQVSLLQVPLQFFTTFNKLPSGKRLRSNKEHLQMFSSPSQPSLFPPVPARSRR